MDSGPWAPCALDLSTPATLAIGCFAAICRGRLADLLVAFGRVAPDVDVGVRELPRAAMLPALATGELDVAVMPARPLTDRPQLKLWRDQAVVAMAADHPLATRPQLTADEVAAASFLIPRQDQGSELHRFLAERIAASATPTGVLCDLGLPRLLERVAAGREVALVPDTLPLGDGLVARPLAGKVGGFAVHAYWQERAPAEPLAALIATLKASTASAQSA